MTATQFRERLTMEWNGAKYRIDSDEWFNHFRPLQPIGIRRLREEHAERAAQNKAAAARWQALSPEERTAHLDACMVDMEPLFSEGELQRIADEAAAAPSIDIEAVLAEHAAAVAAAGDDVGAVIYRLPDDDPRPVDVYGVDHTTYLQEA